MRRMGNTAITATVVPVREDRTMAFGQPTGPPASSGQVRQLLALISAAGYADFREARGPLRLTQRQAGGRFTGDEADALIAQLETEKDDGQASTQAARDRPSRSIAGRPSTPPSCASSPRSCSPLSSNGETGW